MEVCAKYHRPIMIHTGDPAAFFTPLDRYNERWHELNSHPDWLFYGKDYPPQKRIAGPSSFTWLQKIRNTTFIGAHFGNDAEDVATVAKWLDEYPNLVIDIDARISELGRQPYTARKFLIKYQDRVMFGTDTPCDRERLPHLLSVPGDRRRVFRLCQEPPPARLLDDLRRFSAEGRAGEDLLQECRAASVLWR